MNGITACAAARLVAQRRGSQEACHGTSRLYRFHRPAGRHAVRSIPAESSFDNSTRRCRRVSRLAHFAHRWVPAFALLELRPDRRVNAGGHGHRHAAAVLWSLLGVLSRSTWTPFNACCRAAKSSLMEYRWRFRLSQLSSPTISPVVRRYSAVVAAVVALRRKESRDLLSYQVKTTSSIFFTCMAAGASSGFALHVLT